MLYFNDLFTDYIADTYKDESFKYEYQWFLKLLAQKGISLYITNIPFKEDLLSHTYFSSFKDGDILLIDELICSIQQIEKDLSSQDSVKLMEEENQDVCYLIYATLNFSKTIICGFVQLTDYNEMIYMSSLASISSYKEDKPHASLVQTFNCIGAILLTATTILGKNKKKDIHFIDESKQQYYSQFKKISNQSSLCIIESSKGIIIPDEKYFSNKEKYSFLNDDDKLESELNHFNQNNLLRGLGLYFYIKNNRTKSLYYARNNPNENKVQLNLYERHQLSNTFNILRDKAKEKKDIPIIKRNLCPKCGSYDLKHIFKTGSGYKHLRCNSCRHIYIHFKRKKIHKY
ncbi:hypothetical protein [Francisella frigiditurris]|uniref:Uncharacterized protein n=1 Tax=Francisella frigiditurris TaxID=1542390 RepID=A0A1J0KTG6_9GAMM|nr:hypothetical protein [Francisella frigiditurris]APC96987.1 hypothetical protein KX01_1845 [Francisella frigiditurris]